MFVAPAKCSATHEQLRSRKNARKQERTEREKSHSCSAGFQPAVSQASSLQAVRPRQKSTFDRPGPSQFAREHLRARLTTLFATITLLSLPNLHAENWPCWRGPRGDGTSADHHFPTAWSSTSNVLWKTQLPGAGHASPIVFNNRLFTVTALLPEHERRLLCLDRVSGKILWQRTVIAPPLEGKHALNSFASSTPATDGQSVYVAFLDGKQMAVAAYDFHGEQKWLVRPGVFSSMHGFCSSPLLYENLVIVNGDHDGDSYLVALDRKDGRTVWKTPRRNHTRSYCVPIIRQLSGRTQMILSGDKSVASYDPATGTEHWFIDGPTEQFVASIVYNEKADLLFVTGGFPELHLLGLRHDRKGHLDESAIVWHGRKGVSYVPSPISEGEYFLIVSDGGIASCIEAKTGNALWQERLGGDHHASLVSADGLVYFLSDAGVTTVLKPGPEFRVLARNELGEHCFASPALSGGQIFIRGDQHLFCLQSSPPARH